MISMIWAMDENRLIGKDNILPWHLPKDLAYFKKMTENETVLMGDLTYQSLKGYYKNKPLPYKKIYVANIKETEYPDALCITNLFEFLDNVKEDIMVIGGKTIYALCLPYANRLYITHILGRYEGNVYFPYFDISLFKLINKEMTDHMIFATYERK